MIRFGVLGAARIAPPALLLPATRHPDVAVTVIASRDAQRAQAMADEYSIASVAKDYRALVEHPDIDAVYNALPPSEHRRWSVAALHAGKHVLCEKPFALNAGEAATMVAAARHHDRVLLEAFHYRYHPLFVRLLELCRAGTIGAIEHIEGRFLVPIAHNDGELRYSVALGGGAMMDLGCYPLHMARQIAGSEPRIVSATGSLAPGGVDVSMQAELEFDGDLSARIACSMQRKLHISWDSDLVVRGAGGEITAYNPVGPHHDGKLYLQRTGQKRTAQGFETDATSYDHQLAHFVAAVRGECPPLTGGEDAINTMAAIDAIYTAAGQPRH